MCSQYLFPRQIWSARQVNSVLMENTLSQDGYKPQCSGLGVIDCTGECAGTEEEFKEFMDGGILMWVAKVKAKAKDFDFDFEKFPELAKVRAKVTGVMVNGLLKCTWWSNFFQETRFVQSKERTW